jgi:hypothetical protein
MKVLTLPVELQMNVATTFHPASKPLCVLNFKIPRPEQQTLCVEDITVIESPAEYVFRQLTI